MYNGEDKRQRNSKPGAIPSVKEFGSAGFSHHSIPRAARKRRQRAPASRARHPLQSLTLFGTRSVQSPIDRMRARIVASFSEDRPNLPVTDVFRRILL